jgi:hypothetical protein
MSLRMSDSDSSRPTAPGSPPLQNSGLGGALWRVWVLACSTLTQLVRMKVFVFLILATLVLAAMAFAVVTFSPEEELKLIRDVALGSMHLFASLLAIAATAILLPRDVEDRTLYTILSKPVPRYEYLIGKWLGVVLLIGICLLFMDLFYSAILWWRQESLIQAQLAAFEAAGQLDAGLAEEVRTAIASQGLTWGFHSGAFGILLQGAVLTSAVLLLSTIATSTLFTILAGVAVLLIGHGQELARRYFLEGQVSTTMERLIATPVAIVFPDFSLFQSAADAASVGTGLPLGDLLRLTTIAVLYILVYKIAASLIFAEREL